MGEKWRTFHFEHRTLRELKVSKFQASPIRFYWCWGHSAQIKEFCQFKVFQRSRRPEHSNISPQDAIYRKEKENNYKLISIINDNNLITSCYLQVHDVSEISINRVLLIWYFTPQERHFSMLRILKFKKFVHTLLKFILQWAIFYFHKKTQWQRLYIEKKNRKRPIEKLTGNDYCYSSHPWGTPLKEV